MSLGGEQTGLPPGGHDWQEKPNEESDSESKGSREVEPNKEDFLAQLCTQQPVEAFHSALPKRSMGDQCPFKQMLSLYQRNRAAMYATVIRVIQNMKECVRRAGMRLCHCMCVCIYESVCLRDTHTL